MEDENIISDAVIIKKLFSDAIVCMNSGLYIYNYTGRTPNVWHLAVSKNSSKSRFEIEYPKLKVHYIVDKYLKIGVSETVYEGHEISIYNRERTICDAIRYEKKMDKELFNQSIRNFINDLMKKIANLMKFSSKVNIERKTKMIIGIWM